MIDIIFDTLIDGVKLLPFLFLTFLLIEYIEHKVDNKKIIQKSGKFGPLVGSLLGTFPQCGFGVSATNLYATRIISLGTLISVYLSTSDEMLPIMISNGTDINIILRIIFFKVLIGMTFGFLIDFFMRNKKSKIDIERFCEETHCHCEDGIFKSVLKHTINIFTFIIIISFILNLIFNYFGEDTLSKLFMKGNLISPFISSLVGLIPNCASSVLITELYLNNAISFGSAMAGLLSGSGVALLVLFKANINMKENISILLTVYLIGSFMGLLIEIMSLILT